MAVILGSGQFKYEVRQDWGKLPDGWSYKEVAAVAVDKKDQVYVFNRGEHPVIVFDREGNFLRSWGEGVFPHAHGIDLAPDGTLFLTDDGDHTVKQCTLEGKVLLTIGIPGKPAPYMSGAPFHRCTHTAISPQGDIYVSDGYGNARVHKYTAGGKPILAWGEPGPRKGQFNVVHNIACDADGWVYVADRENHRVQVFDGNGRYESQWNNLHRPSAMHMEEEKGRDTLFYIGEIAPVMPVNRDAHNFGPRVTILTNKGEILASLGGIRPGNAPGQFLSPHGIAVDSRGDIYVGEVGRTAWPQLFYKTPEPPADLRTLHKLVRVE